MNTCENRHIPRCTCCFGDAKKHLAIGSHDLFRCTNCGTSFCFPIPSDEALSDFYARYHLSDEMGGLYDAVESRMIADFPAKLAFIKQTTEPKHLLDIGCGKGFFVNYCRQKDIDAKGIDLSTSAIEYATRQFKTGFTCGKIEEADWSTPFDTVTLWATIEHVPDPRNLLQTIYYRLPVGGTLHLDTGIGYDWLDRFLPGNVQWYDPPQHLYVFSEIGLKSLCASLGFEIIRYQSCFERTVPRKIARHTRNIVFSLLLNGVTLLTQTRKGMKDSARLPIGNLQSLSLRKTRST